MTDWLHASAETKNEDSKQNAFFAQNDVQSVADGDSQPVDIGLHWFDIRWSRSQGRWSLLLYWLASVSVTTVTSLPVRFPASSSEDTRKTWFISHTARQFPNPQCTMHAYSDMIVRYMTFNDHFIANFVLSESFYLIGQYLVNWK